MSSPKRMIRKHQPVSLVKKLYPSCTWEKSSSNKIFLTFDDGPHPTVTPWVLDQLDTHHAKATFFCVGANLKKNPELANELLERGHRLANHTFNHENGFRTSTSAYLQSVNNCNKYLADAHGIKNHLFRPPYGKIKRSQLLPLRTSFDIILWSHLAWDFVKKLDHSKTVQILSKAKPGSIIVFHDTEKAYDNLKIILPQLLTKWSANGHKFATL